MENTQQNVATTVAATPAQKNETVQEALNKMKGQFAMVLPKHLTPERLCRVALNACHATPKLLQCERKTLFSALMRAAQLGLEPDGVLGQAYLIPFKRNFKVGNEWQSVMEVQFIVGYKGLIDLARRSGDVSNIIAKEVYANDEFTIDWSQEIPFVHKPKMDGERGEVKYFWALARFKDGGFHWDYMSVAEIEAIRDKGNGAKNAVWTDHFIEMGKKTMIRRIAKYLPMSVQKAALTEDLAEQNKPFHLDNFGDIIIDGDAEEVPESPKLGNSAVKEKITKKADAAKKANANPETGELPDDATSTQETSPASEEAIATYDNATIKLYTVAGNAASTDFERWKGDFLKGCNSAPSNAEIAKFYANNVKVLNQVKTRAPIFFDECERAYKDNCERLEIAAQ